MDSRPRLRLLACLLLVVGLVVSGCGFLDKGADARKAADKLATALQKRDAKTIPFTDQAAARIFSWMYPRASGEPFWPSMRR